MPIFRKKQTIMYPSTANRKKLVLTGLCLLLTSPLHALACWDQAAQRYGVPAQLLIAIARVESDLNPHAVNRVNGQRNASFDIGLMQINSSNLPTLAQYGIHEADLFDACTNIHVGAWLLAKSFERNGVTWNGLGAYNAACTKLKGENCRRARIKYAWLVYRQLTPQRSRQRQFDISNATRASGSASPKVPLILASRVFP